MRQLSLRALNDSSKAQSSAPGIESRPPTSSVKTLLNLLYICLSPRIDSSNQKGLAAQLREDHFWVTSVITRAGKKSLLLLLGFQPHADGPGSIRNWDWRLDPDFFKIDLLLFPCSAPHYLNGPFGPKSPGWCDQLLWLYVLFPLSQEENDLRDIEYKLWEGKNHVSLVR